MRKELGGVDLSSVEWKGARRWNSQASRSAYFGHEARVRDSNHDGQYGSVSESDSGLLVEQEIRGVLKQ